MTEMRVNARCGRTQDRAASTSRLRDGRALSRQGSARRRAPVPQGGSGAGGGAVRGGASTHSVVRTAVLDVRELWRTCGVEILDHAACAIRWQRRDEFFSTEERPISERYYHDKEYWCLYSCHCGKGVRVFPYATDSSLLYFLLLLSKGQHQGTRGRHSITKKTCSHFQYVLGEFQIKLRI